MSGHVFISYSREDRRYVETLVNYLLAAGVRAWLDKEIATGDRWDTVIREKIETAAAVIVVMSPAADDSMWVTNEIHHAQAVRIPILPLLLKGKPFFTLARIHHEDVTGGQMPGEAFTAKLLDLQNTQPSAPPRTEKNSIAQRVRRHSHLATTAGIVVLLVVIALVVQPWRDDQSERQPAEDGIPNAVIDTSGAAVEAIAFSPDSKILATGGGNDHTVRLWNPTTGQLIRPLVGEGVASAVAFSPDGRIVAFNGDLAMWNPTTGEEIVKIASGGWSIAFSPDSRTLAVGDLSNTVTLWETETGRLIRSITLTNDQGTVVESVAFSPDGETVAAGGHEGTIQLWDPRTGTNIRTITNNGGAYWISFSPDGMIFANNGDGPVRSWNTASGEQVRTLAEATKAALSPDGKLLATAGKADYAVRLWDSATGELVDTFAGHTNAVEGIAFSNDGRLLATGGADQTIRLWKIPT